MAYLSLNLQVPALSLALSSLDGGVQTGSQENFFLNQVALASVPSQPQRLKLERMLNTNLMEKIE